MREGAGKVNLAFPEQESWAALAWASMHLDPYLEDLRGCGVLDYQFLSGSIPRGQAETKSPRLISLLSLISQLSCLCMPSNRQTQEAKGLNFLCLSSEVSYENTHNVPRKLHAMGFSQPSYNRKHWFHFSGLCKVKPKLSEVNSSAQGHFLVMGRLQDPYLC